jgi:hypothetical protein
MCMSQCHCTCSHDTVTNFKRNVSTRSTRGYSKQHVCIALLYGALLFGLCLLDEVLLFFLWDMTTPYPCGQMLWTACACDAAIGLAAKILSSQILQTSRRKSIGRNAKIKSFWQVEECGPVQSAQFSISAVCPHVHAFPTAVHWFAFDIVFTQGRRCL